MDGAHKKPIFDSLYEPQTAPVPPEPRVRHRSRSVSSIIDVEPQSPFNDEDFLNPTWPLSHSVSVLVGKPTEAEGHLDKDKDIDYSRLPKAIITRSTANLCKEQDHTVKPMPSPEHHVPPSGPVSVRKHAFVDSKFKMKVVMPDAHSDVYLPLSAVPVTAPVTNAPPKLEENTMPSVKFYSSVNMIDENADSVDNSDPSSQHNSSSEIITSDIWDKLREASLSGGPHQRSPNEHRSRSPDPVDLCLQNGLTWGKPRFGRPAGASDDEQGWGKGDHSAGIGTSKYSSGGAFAYLRQTFKHKLAKYQQYCDRASELLAVGDTEATIHGLSILGKVMYKAWSTPKYGHDLAYSLCDYLRQYHGMLDIVVQALIGEHHADNMKLAAARALEELMSMPNRKYLADHGLIEKIANTVKVWNEPPEKQRVAVSVIEGLFKLSADTSMLLIDLSCLDFILNACKSMPGSQTSRHVALALANLAMYSDHDCQVKMISKKVQDWLFLLASVPDPVTRYYACLAICMLVSNKELEAAVIKSGTLSLVEPFLLAHKPNTLATCDYKRSQGRPKEWLEKLVPMLQSKRKEPRSLAAFHFAMEATVKKEQDRLDVFQEINAISALKEVASAPDEVAPKFASMALKIIGEEVPYKLSQQVPLWTIEDVQCWVSKIGYSFYAKIFAEQMVDGDLLLLLDERELERDIGMTSGLLRKRFMRELEDLKISADYSCLDETSLDRFLMSLSPDLSNYTYQLLQLGVDRNFLPNLTEEQLATVCGITNPVHRMRLANALLECQHCDDAEVAVLSKHIDIFISYRRSTGNQLASLIKVLLQLKGYKVFIDVDRLYAGKFDTSLLKNIQAAKHFVLVLSAGSLDRCLGDDVGEDWVHKEVLCALQHNKNVVPIFDADFVWPDESLIPSDIRAIARFNGVRWVHEYQEACVSKLEQFLTGTGAVAKDGTRSGRSYPSTPSVPPTNRYPTLNRPSSAGVLAMNAGMYQNQRIGKGGTRSPLNSNSLNVPNGDTSGLSPPVIQELKST